MKSTTLLLSALLMFAMLAGETRGQTFVQNFPDADVGSSTLGVANASTLYVAGLFDNLMFRNGVSIIASTAGAQSSTLQYGDRVNAAIPDGAGGFFVAGQFSWAGPEVRSRIARINSNGTVNGTFSPVSVNGPVHALLLSGGFLYVGGEFTSINGSTRNRLARLVPSSGNLDTTFTIGVTGTARPKVLALEQNSGGTAVYIGGDFDNVGGTTRNNIAKINIGTPSTVNTGFTTGTDNTVWTIRMASSGTKLFIGGDFANVGTKARLRIAKVEESSGVGVTGWNPGANGSVRDIELLSTTNIFTCGAFTQIDAKNRNRMAKVDASSGAAQAGFVISGTVNDTIFSITSDGSTNWFVAGAFTTFDGVSRGHLAEVDGAGNVLSWNPGNGGWTQMRAVAFDPSFTASGIFCGGRNDHTFSSPHLGRIVNNAAGFPDVFSTTPPYATGFAFRTVTGTDRVLAVGPDATFFGNSVNRGHFAEWAVGGNMTSTEFRPVFGTGGKLWDIAVDGNTAIVVGAFSQLERFDGAVWGDTVARNNIAAVDLSTSPISFTAFDPNANGVIYDVVISSGIAYVAGAFTQIGGQARAGVAAVDLATGNVTAWNPNPSPSGSVNAIAADTASIFLGGSFTSAGGSSRSNVASVDLVNGTATAWNPGTNGNVYALTVDGANLYVGGGFTTLGGLTRNRVGVLNKTTGVMDSTWNPNCNNAVFDIAIYNNQVVMAGSFTVIMSREKNGLAAVTRAAGGAPKTVLRPISDAAQASAGSIDIMPNPSRGDAAIEFTPANDGVVTVALYSSIGEEARLLFSGQVEHGRRYGLTLERGDLPPGVYLLRMMNGAAQAVKRMVIVE